MRILIIDEPQPCANCGRSFVYEMYLKRAPSYAGEESRHAGDIPALKFGAQLNDASGTGITAEIPVRGKCLHCYVFNVAILKVDAGKVIGIMPKSRLTQFVPPRKQ